MRLSSSLSFDHLLTSSVISMSSFVLELVKESRSFLAKFSAATFFLMDSIFASHLANSSSDNLARYSRIKPTDGPRVISLTVPPRYLSKCSPCAIDLTYEVRVSSMV